MAHSDERERSAEASQGQRRDAGSEVGGKAPRPAGEAEAQRQLDLGGLDLSIETVEERISPGETNVFDK